MRRVALALASAATMLSCSLNRRPPVGEETMAQLWEDPVDLERRDLFVGPDGREDAPLASAPFQLLDVKERGTQPGYDVRDAQGREWSVKLGVESRTEVTVSRLVWAVGYHQPPNYYLPRWSLRSDSGITSHEGARFRLEHDGYRKRGEWSWRRNPFLGTRQLAGLFVLMVIVNNGDLKADQNALYELRDRGGVHRRYLVRDLGASLGKPAWLGMGTKSDVEGFEDEGFIAGVEDNRVRFHFHDAWREPQLHTSVTPDDVRWICGLLNRLTDAQWRGAFRAGGFSNEEAERYITRLRQKVASGLALTG